MLLKWLKDCSIFRLQKLIFLGHLLLLLKLGFLLARCLLLLQSLCFCFFCLGFMDGLDKHTLVLVAVTLGLDVEEVVDVFVNLLLLAVLAQQPTEHPQAAHPNHLCWHPCLAGSAALACSLVAALALGFEVFAHARPGVHLDRLTVDESILDQFADIEARVGHRDLPCLIWVEPYALLTALLDG